MAVCICLMTAWVLVCAVGPYRAGGRGRLKVKGKQQAWDLAGP